MKKALLGLLLCTTVQLVAQQDKRLKNIDKQLTEILQETQAAGFAVAVVEKNNIIYAKGFGYKDYENKVPANANTLFAIGSSTKAFTSALLGQLRKEEKIDFNDSPIKYLPSLRFYNDDMNNNINIKDLMSHRTGLPRHDFSWYFFPNQDKDSLLQRVAYQEPFTGIREQWHYNNFMFLAQGQITAKITGESWEDNIRTRFFKPLAMQQSTVELDEFLTRENRSFGYTLTEEETIEKMDYYDISGMSPAGSIYSNVNEMSNWLKVWINGGKFNGTEILPENFINEAISSHMIIGAALPDKKIPDAHFSTYGYGWMLSSYKGHYRVEHGGNIDGFSANVAFFPSDSIGIVVLSNQNGSAVPNLVRNTLADRLLKVKPTAWVAKFREEKAKSKQATADAKKLQSATKRPNTKPSHGLHEYIGSYHHKGYGRFTIDLVNDSLLVNFPLKKLFLRHLHYDVFEPFEYTKKGIDTTSKGPLRFNFMTNTSGDIDHVAINIEPLLSPISFERKATSIEVDLSTLQRYVGKYKIATTTITIYIKDDKTLYALVPGQPDYELVPTAPNKFTFKIMNEFKVAFVENANHEVEALKMIQPNGTFRADKIE